MLEVADMAALETHIGERLGPTEWLEITQERIDQFAACTGDHQWIHTDVARAAHDMPEGKTIAHGWLLVSLLGEFMPQFLRVQSQQRSINYGCNRLRFIRTVPSGARIRAWMTIRAVAAKHGGKEITSEIEYEIDGSEKSALALEHLRIIYE